MTVCVTSTVHFVVIIQPHQHQGLRLLSLQMFMLLNLNEPDVCITFCVHTTRVSVNSDSDILQNQNFRNWSRR